MALALIVLGLALVVGSMMASWSTKADEALGILRARFARGEIDAEEFGQIRDTLRPPGPARSAPGRLLVAGSSLLVLGLLAGVVASAWSMSTRGMMGSGMMGTMSPAPTAPPGISVTMAAARFAPADLSVHVGATVRWFNDDVMPHTVTAADRSWDSGNLSPGSAFERRFDTAGTYHYVCVYHSWMTGTVTVAGG